MHSVFLLLHCNGPYANIHDTHELQYIGLSLVKCVKNYILCGGDRCEVLKCEVSCVKHRSHQESRSPIDHQIKCVLLIHLGFVIKNTRYSDLPINSPIDISDPAEYIQLASTIKASGVPNYNGIRVSLTSTLVLEHIKQEIQDYHDQILLDYLTFGFPLCLNEGANITSNATDNHASANQFPEAVDD